MEPGACSDVSEIPQSLRRSCALLPTSIVLLISIFGIGPTFSDGGHGFGRVQAQVEPKQSPDKEDPALVEFLRIYHLDADEDLKHIPPPRPEGIRAFLKRSRKNFPNQLDLVGAMTFRWKDPDRLANWSRRSDDAGYSLKELPRHLEMNIYPSEIDGDPDLLKTTIAGDWVYRVGAPDERKARILEIRLQRVLRKRISVNLREVERDVVLVRGSFRYSPIQGRAKNQVEIYGRQIVPGGEAGHGLGSYDTFLKWVGEWIGRPVVNEVETKPKDSFEWFYNGRSPSNEQMRREDHDETLVLQHLREQTGLTFTIGKKTIPILFIEKPK